MNAGHTLSRWLEPAGWRGLACVLPVVVLIHLGAAAVLIRYSNQDETKSDQGAEMWLAATSRDDWVPQRTDGVRHPLWSWVARQGYTADKAAFFARGKWMNTGLCVVFLCVLGGVASRWLDRVALANLLLLCSLGILLVRGTYFQPEPLYYVFSFLAAVLAWRLLGGAPVGYYGVFGVVAGLAFLAKPSLAPFLLVFGVAWAVRFLPVWRQEGWSLVGKVLMAAVLFGVLLVPLARFSAEHFGRPFFNYTKFWMWMDDFETEAWPFQDKYPGGAQLKTLRPEDTPSAAWYFRRHSAADAFQRLTTGASEVTVRFFFPESKLKFGAMFWRDGRKKWEQPLAHRGVYALVLLGLVVFLAVLARGEVGRALASPEARARAVFVLLLGGIYVALYGWYWPIGKGDRFMGSLWIPCIFLLTWLGWQLRRSAASGSGDAIYLGVHTVILLSVLVQVAGMFWRFHQGIYLVTRN